VIDAQAVRMKAVFHLRLGSDKRAGVLVKLRRFLLASFLRGTDTFVETRAPAPALVRVLRVAQRGGRAVVAQALLVCVMGITRTRVFRPPPGGGEAVWQDGPPQDPTALLLGALCLPPGSALPPFLTELVALVRSWLGRGIPPPTGAGVTRRDFGLWLYRNPHAALRVLHEVLKAQAAWIMSELGDAGGVGTAEEVGREETRGVGPPDPSRAAAAEATEGVEEEEEEEEEVDAEELEAEYEEAEYEEMDEAWAGEEGEGEAAPFRGKAYFPRLFTLVPRFKNRRRSVRIADSDCPSIFTEVFNAPRSLAEVFVLPPRRGCVPGDSIVSNGFSLSILYDVLVRPASSPGAAGAPGAPSPPGYGRGAQAAAAHPPSPHARPPPARRAAGCLHAVEAQHRHGPRRHCVEPLCAGGERVWKFTRAEWRERTHADRRIARTRGGGTPPCGSRGVPSRSSPRRAASAGSRPSPGWGSASPSPRACGRASSPRR